jgi:four helix bundle protein
MSAPDNLKLRTRQFALAVIRFIETLPTTRSTEVIGRQLLRAGTSVGANYRAACRAKSPAHFISEMGDVEEEADECCFWLELLLEEKLGNQNSLQTLLSEANELVAISVASINTARKGARAVPHSALRTPHS